MIYSQTASSSATAGAPVKFEGICYMGIPVPQGLQVACIQHCLEFHFFNFI